MEYRTLTGTGITVSRACLGTMTFGRETDEPRAIRMVRMALDAGVNFIDEADVYAGSRSETIVGKALEGVRDEVVLASKVANFSGKNRLRDAGLHRWHVIKGVEDSLKRLQTDRLDILYMHRPDYATPIEETLAAFDTLVQQGKVVYVGMSNFAAWQVCEALWRADVGGWAPPVVTQLPYNLITRGIDQECVPFLKKMQMGMTVYNPLAGGMLTGKYERGGPAEQTRFAENPMYHDRFWHEANFAAVDRLKEVAGQAGLSLIELSFRWLKSQAHVNAIIVGARTLEHLAANLAALEGDGLDEATLQACDEVWADLRGPSFPYNR
jgi:aryl-alcohol dehydrogenase-like predicted oxidoreductase